MKFDRTKFFAGYRDAFGPLNQTQVDGLNSLLSAFEAQTLISDVRQIGYCLATVKHECADTYQPIEEYGKGRGKPYGVPTGQYGKVYFGRSYVQLTWERNYAHATDRLHQLGLLDPNLSLEQTPELAMRPDIAAAILVVGMSEGWFTGKKLSDYINDHSCDFFNARRIINGTDQAQRIAGYAQAFVRILSDSEVS